MFYFIGVYIWCWTILPLALIITSPFLSQSSLLVSKHFLYDILRIQHNISSDSEIISNGFILANHRGWIDGMFDSYISKSSMVTRYMVFLGVPFVCLSAWLDNRALFINRGKDRRDTVYSQCVAHIQRYNTRIVFYPEGTRNNYLSLDSEDELRKYIKFGLLKSIYQDKRYPVQLQISNNKERTFNEKKMSVGFCVPINTRISKPIHPKDFSTDTEFFNEIIRVWYDCYKTTHV